MAQVCKESAPILRPSPQKYTHHTPVETLGSSSTYTTGTTKPRLQDKRKRANPGLTAFLADEPYPMRSIPQRL